ncbi:MAG TPA: Sua5 family C-terminal domain-containing protein, partial [Longimicrobiaceae bacterium]|nr:Sua5 family C-terminal domain-containing protein [Longimicrobiaceae bacterium]
HPVALALLRAAALPVAAPSANRSTEISPSTAEHVAKSLGGRVDLILDGGPTRVGIESTVLDLTGPRPALLRPGSLSVDDLRPIAGDIVLPSADASGDAPRPSPGMMDRHYAPRAPLFTLGAGALTESVLRDGAAGRRAGVVSMTGDRLAGAETIVLPRDPAAYAAGLYAALHELDDRGVDVIYVEAVPDGAAWAGVRDRLRRASHRG